MAATRFELLPPAEAVAYFEAKGYRPTFSWKDMLHEEHGVDFTVAKSAGYDILSDIRQAMDRAIKEGRTPRDFARELTPVLQEKGWWGVKEMLDPLTGEVSRVQLGSPRRLKIIYDTNLRTAHAAGRWERIQRVKAARPYLRLCAVLDEHTRPEHRAMNGTVLPVDHPYWDTNYPPNGWRCRCFVLQLSDRDLARRGESVSPDPDVGLRPWRNGRTGQVHGVPKGVDPGFGYNVGKARMRALTPPNLSVPLGHPYAGPPAAVPPPAPRAVPADRLLPAGMAPEFYVDRFLAEFGATRDKPVVFTDALGEPVVISADLFRDARGRWKVLKRGRERSLLLLADAIRSPDEIWWQWREYPAGRHTLLRRYLARYQVDGQSAPAFVLFDIGRDGWNGVTGFQPKREGYLDKERQGTLAWRRPG